MPSSLVLLNADGSFSQKLQLVSIPPGYVVPEGKIISWKDTVKSLGLGSYTFHPIQAYFYFGCAWGQVTRKLIISPGHFILPDEVLEIIVQSTDGQDLNQLRDRIMHTIQNSSDRNPWKVHNDLNPKKPSTIVRLLKKIGSWLD